MTNLDLIEDAWYALTKGELNLEEDPEAVAAAHVMWAQARTYVDMVDAQQFGADGREIATVDDAEIARRVAECFAMLSWGGSVVIRQSNEERTVMPSSEVQMRAQNVLEHVGVSSSDENVSDLLALADNAGLYKSWENLVVLARDHWPS